VGLVGEDVRHDDHVSGRSTPASDANRPQTPAADIGGAFRTIHAGQRRESSSISEGWCHPPLSGRSTPRSDADRPQSARRAATNRLSGRSAPDGGGDRPESI
jgi:hypothetical protein